MSGIEGAVHALREVFAEKAGSGWGVLLIDQNCDLNRFPDISTILNDKALYPAYGIGYDWYAFKDYTGRAVKRPKWGSSRLLIDSLTNPELTMEKMIDYVKTNNLPHENEIIVAVPKER